MRQALSPFRRGARSRKRAARFVAVFALVAAAAGAFSLWASGAVTVFPDSNVSDYAGCLNNGGFTHLAVGDTPAHPCGPNEVEVHLSGGDITAVRTPPGSGLTGGTDNGSATLALANGFSLPQSCSDGQVPKWSGTSSSWACGSDNNTTYTNSTGLDLSGNSFSIDPGYRLPQSCASGQTPQSTGSNTWTCGSPAGGLSTFTVNKDFSIGTEDNATGVVDCPSGSIPTGGGYWAGSLTVLKSSPSTDGPSFGGWEVDVSSGLFDNGTFTVYVVCLKTS